MVFRFMSVSEDQEMLGDADKNLSTGLFGKPMTLQADQLLKDKDQLGGGPVFPFRCSIHRANTPGGCCFYFPEEQVLFSGGYPFLRLRGKNGFSGGKQLRTGDFRASSSEGTSGRRPGGFIRATRTIRALNRKGAGTPMRKEKTK